MSLRARLVLGCAAALALLVLSYAATRVAERGRFATPYSTYGAGPEGARALLLLARQLGYGAQPFARDLSQLPRGTLISFGGCRATDGARKVSRPEREALARWVEAGGLLISLGVADVLPSGAGLSFSRPPECPEDDPGPLATWLGEAEEASDTRAQREVVVEAAGPPLSHLLPFTVRAVRPLRLGHDAEATEILTSSEGTLGLTAPYGRGRVVLLGISEAFTNEALSDGGGLVFARLLRAFAPSGPIWFDEYHLGMGERRSLVGYARDLGYGPILLQGLLAAIAALAALSVRIAPVARGREQPGATRIQRSFLEALGALFQRSGDTRAALELLARAALARLAEGYHARAVPAQRLEAWLRLRGLFAAAHYAHGITRHAAQPLAPGETLVSRAQAIDQDATLAVAIAVVSSRVEPRASTVSSSSAGPRASTHTPGAPDVR